ncbi:collagen-binding protein [Fulvitalea axinellae]|uniref:Collagen-binding protein n=1 Tax=Fulvitalea axinellae TaxID=1182444 RepID=A0AAU9CJX4_9BACT|nr:collagen-binding protein [Fulvitalea axinellae]
MRVSRTLLLVVSIFFLALESMAQNVVQIKGTVYDSETKEPIPFVNVVLKNRKEIGTITDVNGKFSFKAKVKGKKAVLLASFIGYLPTEQAVEIAGLGNVEILLNTETRKLDEVVFEAPENPAYAVIRKAAKRKRKLAPEDLDHYTFKSYKKSELFVKDFKVFEKWKVAKEAIKVVEKLKLDGLRNEDGSYKVPILVAESFLDIYHEKGRDARKLEKSHVTGIGVDPDDNVSRLMADNSFNGFDFSKDEIFLLDKNVPSPIGDAWRITYEMWMIDSLAKVGADPCYKIEVEPRAKGDIAFSGKIWITKKDFALRKLDLKLAVGANMNYVSSVDIRREYIKGAGNKWYVKRSRLDLDVSDTGPFPGVFLRLYTLNNGFDSTTPMPQGVFDDRYEIAESKEYDDEAYWETFRDSLSVISPQDAISVHQVIDSIQDRPAIKRFTVVGKIVANSYIDGKYVDWGSVLSLYAWNNVEGHRFQFGFRTTKKFSERWFFKPSIAYGTKDNKWKYSLDAIYNINRSKGIFVGATVRRDLRGLAQLGFEGESTRYLRAYTRWGNIDRRNPYYNDEFKAFFTTRFKRNWSPSFSMRYRKLSAVKPVKFASAVEEIKPWNEVRSVEGEIGLKYVQSNMFVLNRSNKLIPLGAKRKPIFTLNAAYGMYKDGSDWKPYQRFSAGIRQRNAPLTALGSTWYKLEGGVTLGEVPYQLMKVHQGNESMLNFTGAIQMMKNFEFVSDHYVEAKVEHYFDGKLITRLPGLSYLNHWFDARILLIGDVVWGGMSDTGKEFNSHYINTDGKKRGYHRFRYLEHDRPFIDAGVGIENIFKLLRIDFMRRLTYLEPEYGGKNWAIKLSARFKF